MICGYELLNVNLWPWKFHIFLSLRRSAFSSCDCGNLAFTFLGGVSRRVFIPPRLSEIASSAKRHCLLARTDQGRCLSSILSLRGHEFAFYGRGNLSSSKGVKAPFNTFLNLKWAKGSPFNASPLKRQKKQERTTSVLSLRATEVSRSHESKAWWVAILLLRFWVEYRGGFSYLLDWVRLLRRQKFAASSQILRFCQEGRT